MKTIFVTCGATVPFPDLITSILDENFIDIAIKFGYNRLIAQIGNGYTETLLKNVSKLDTTNGYICPLNAEQLGCSEVACSFKLKANDFEFIAIAYSSKIEDIIRNHASLVISHAGTGSILDALKLKKRLLVCVNDKLMDNHQQQIADKFEDLGYIVACKATSTSLIKGIEIIQTKILQEFSTTRNTKFENLLIKTAYSV